MNLIFIKIVAIFGLFSLLFGRTLNWPEFFTIKIYDGLIISDIIFIGCMFLLFFLVFKHWENK